MKLQLKGTSQRTMLFKGHRVSIAYVIYQFLLVNLKLQQLECVILSFILETIQNISRDILQA